MTLRKKLRRFAGTFAAYAVGSPILLVLFIHYGSEALCDRLMETPFVNRWGRLCGEIEEWGYRG